MYMPQLASEWRFGCRRLPADTMIPEAFNEAHNFAELITAAGFLVSFMLSQVGQ